MVASPALTRTLWVFAALVAGAALAAIALHGERPGAGLARYEPRGVMVGTAPDQVTEVLVTEGSRSRRFVRSPDGWVSLPGAPGVAPDLTPLLETALRFLHGSAPQRVMDGDDLAALRLDEIELAPPRLSVRVRAGPREVIAVDFGSLNPQGFAQYARVAGRHEIYLLNRYIGEAWHKVAAR